MKHMFLTESEKKKILSNYSLIKESFPSDGDVEERISYITKRLQEIEDMYWMIESYVETKWGSTVKLEGSKRDVHFAQEDFSTSKIYLNFYIDESEFNKANEIRKEIIGDLKSLFNLDIGKYGEPIGLDFFWRKWESFD